MGFSCHAAPSKTSSETNTGCQPSGKLANPDQGVSHYWDLCSPLVFYFVLYTFFFISKIFRKYNSNEACMQAKKIRKHNSKLRLHASKGLSCATPSRVGKKKGVKTKGKSKKTRRADEVERAFKEADASADRAAARITQSQMLLALFEVFFRVLKQCAQSGVQTQQAQGRL